MYLLFIYIFFTSFSLNLAAPEGPETPSKKKKNPGLNNMKELYCEQ